MSDAQMELRVAQMSRKELLVEYMRLHAAYFLLGKQLQQTFEELDDLRFPRNYRHVERLMDEASIAAYAERLTT